MTGGGEQPYIKTESTTDRTVHASVMNLMMICISVMITPSYCQRFVSQKVSFVVLRGVSAHDLNNQHSTTEKKFAAVTGRTIARNYCSDAEEIPRRVRERYVNTVTLLGRVGRDAELRGIGENQVLVFSLATNPNYEAAADRTAWHRILVSNPRVRDILANMVEKGDRLLVIGRIQYDQYTDAHQVKRTTTTVVANDVIVVSKAKQQRRFSVEEDDLEDGSKGRQQRRFGGEEDNLEDGSKGRQQRRFGVKEDNLEDGSRGRQQRRFGGEEEDLEDDEDSAKRTR